MDIHLANMISSASFADGLTGENTKEKGKGKATH